MQEELAVCTKAGAQVKPGEAVPLICRHCGAATVPRRGPGRGPHAARLDCGACGRFLQWAQKEPRMVACVNQTILLGVIGKYGIVVKNTASGTPCASFTLVLEEHGQYGK